MIFFHLCFVACFSVFVVLLLWAMQMSDFEWVGVGSCGTNLLYFFLFVFATVSVVYLV